MEEGTGSIWESSEQGYKRAREEGEVKRGREQSCEVGRERGSKENGKERQSRDCSLIYGGFPFNEIVSLTEPVKGP